MANSRFNMATSAPPRPRRSVPVAAGNGKGSTPGTAVARYGSRHWAIYLNGQLLAVTVYKKGAVAIQEALGAAPLRT
ncbi:MAG: hypothetical protein DME46_01525 [Verrucomicrobia bacterium]|nr:MAG: hypothetical protein DME46_01525 [Verrucomicrobiota bacterium]